eukprot:scaffold5790_cov79-Skeletonema_dohrnii-CCMP3373.AAC.2
MVEPKESPSAAGKENDFHALLLAAEAIASPMPKINAKKKESSSTHPETAVAVASLKRTSSMESNKLPSLSRLVSKEDDEENSVQPFGRQPRDCMMSQSAASQSPAAVAATSKEGEQEDVATLICREALPSKNTQTYATATATASSTIKKETFTPLKRAHQPGPPDFWALTKPPKRVPQATKDR